MEFLKKLKKFMSFDFKSYEEYKEMKDNLNIYEKIIGRLIQVVVFMLFIISSITLILTIMSVLLMPVVMLLNLFWNFIEWNSYFEFLKNIVIDGVISTIILFTMYSISNLFEISDIDVQKANEYRKRYNEEKKILQL